MNWLLDFWFPPLRALGAMRRYEPEWRFDVVYTTTKDGHITWHGENPPYFWLGAEADRP